MEKILNVHNFTSSKNGKSYTVLSIIRDLSDREKQNGYIGNQICEDIFLPDNLVNTFSSSDIGVEIVREYSIVGGKAYLENIIRKEVK